MPPSGPLGALLTRLLWVRGLTSAAEAEAFLEPTLARGLRPPSLLPGLEDAAARIGEALMHGAAVDVAPTAAVEAIVAAAVIRNVLDVGTARADAGLRVGVGPDHLEVGGTRIDGRPLGLGVAGVAFYFLIALRRSLRNRGCRDVPDPRTQLDLAALGTIAGGDPLRLEARVLVALGLRAMGDDPRPGLAALAERAMMARPTARAVMTRVVPRLAAAAALGEGERVLALLTTTSATDAMRLATAIELDAARWAASSTVRDAAAAAEAVVVDAEWSLAEITPRTMMVLTRLEPHGPGNPEPVLVARGARLDGARLAGSPTRPYWRLRLRQDSHTLRAVAQQVPTSEIVVGQLYDVAYTPRAGHVRGGGAIEIVVHDLREHTPLATGQATETTE